MATKSIEKRVSDLEEVIDDIPRLINMRFSLIRAQLDALDARVGTLEIKMDSLRSEVQAMPRVIAEMLDARAKRGGYVAASVIRGREQNTGEAHGRSIHL